MSDEDVKSIRADALQETCRPYFADNSPLMAIGRTKVIGLCDMILKLKAENERQAAELYRRAMKASELKEQP